MSTEYIKDCPGFVDLQVNGYKGLDFSSPSLTSEEICEICDELLSAVTAGFLATMITSSPEIYAHNLPLIGAAVNSQEICMNLLGVHLEGPFISGCPGFVGTHNVEYVQAPDISLFESMYEWSAGSIRLLTIAAEVETAERLARRARDFGITVSIGHSAYEKEDLSRLVDAGATALTHLGNAVPNLLQRHSNQIWTGLANNDLKAMFIADGHHLPDDIIKVLLAVKGVSRAVTVSDVSPMGGLQPGPYQFCGSPVVLEESGAIRNVQKNCFAGSAMTLLPAMNHLATLGILSLNDLLQLGLYNPLDLIGVAPTALPRSIQLKFDPEHSRFSIHNVVL